jgi:two-component system, cell cycle response regulator DivK
MKPRIAVVEDNPDNRLLVRALLEDRYHLTEFETGLEAVGGLVQAGPDLVLLDISLPGMDGGEVLRWIRAQEGLRSVPVVALTAHAMTGDREKFMAMGFDEYLAKPIVDEGLLLDILSRFLEPQA